MRLPLPFRLGRFPAYGLAGATLLVIGEALIIARARPASDFYFPFVWIGYFLLLDGAVYRQTGSSLFTGARRYVIAMLPMSAAFWWLFELFNEFVHSWSYIGMARYNGVSYVAFATLDFGCVLIAVWASAQFVNVLLPGAPSPGRVVTGPVPVWAPRAMLAAGAIAVALPVLWPRYFFGMIWLCLFFLLDPVNYRLGRPSILAAVAGKHWRIPTTFALGALMCGFFWEAWNFWSMPKWVYTIPYVYHWHVFEMPLLGWSGYLPFGLELYAMANFVFPLLGLEPLGLSRPASRQTNKPSREMAS